MPAKKNGSKPATQEKLQEVRYGLKGDIKKLRDDLKADISRLDQKIDRVGMELIKTREKIATKEDLKGLKQDMQRLLKIATDSAEKGKVYFEKALSHGDILSQHESKLRDHGRRLTAVESK